MRVAVVVTFLKFFPLFGCDYECVIVGGVLFHSFFHLQKPQELKFFISSLTLFRSAIHLLYGKSYGRLTTDM